MSAVLLVQTVQFSNLESVVSDGNSFCDVRDFGACSVNGITELSWSTHTENYTRKFTVERSVNGDSFRPVAFVHAAGNSCTELQYRHADVVRPSGTIFYRLTAFYESGESLVVAGPVETSSENAVNPERFTFSLIQNDQKASLLFPGFANTPVTVSIADLSGNNVLRQKLMTDEQGISEEFTCNCGTGIYFVTVVVNGIMRSRALTIAN